MLPQGIAHQCRTIPLGSACSLIGRMQQLLIEYDLNCLHLCRTYSTVYSTSLVQEVSELLNSILCNDGSKGWFCSALHTFWVPAAGILLNPRSELNAST